MNSKIIVKRARSLAKPSLDLPMAAVAALAVAFIAFAMPDAHFTRLVTATGLPSFVPAAAPPLGGTARMAMILAGAIGTFAAVFLILRMLDRRPRVAQSVPSEQPAFTMPKLRRADAHPDAPARRPFFAALDIGDPVAASGSNPEAEEDADRGEAVEPIEEWPQSFASEPADDAIEVSEELQPWPLLAASTSFEADHVGQPAKEAHSIADLMRRLERGVAARGTGTGSPPADPLDDRLRSALGDLQKLTRRQA